MLEYNLHDSGINSLSYSSEQKRVVIGITLCNWIQEYYNETIDSELLSVTMIFDGVTNYDSTIAEDYRLDLSEIVAANEISSDVLQIVLTGTSGTALVTIGYEKLSWINNGPIET